MKKRNLILVLILPFLASCGNTGGGSSIIDPLPYVEPEPEVKEDTLYLGLKENKKYIPSTKVTFNVTVEDNTLVTYSKEDGCFVTNTKVGATIARFVSEKLTYNVSIIVRDDGTAPIFTLDEEEISVNKGDEYLINASLSYRGLNVFDEADDLAYTLESNSSPVTSLTIDGNVIKVKASSVGNDTYTIYTTYLGHTISKLLNIKVIENKAFVIIGARLSFDDDGPVYEISTDGYSENKINLKNDLVITKGGVTISYNDVTITSLDETAVSVVNDEIIPHKTGISYLKVSYGGETKLIKIKIFKPVIETKNITIDDNKFNLNLSVSVKNQARVYTADKSNTKVITLDIGSYSFNSVSSIKVGGVYKEITSEKPASISGNKLTLSAALFDINDAGEKEVSVTLEASEYLVEYKFSLLFVTKSLSVKADFDTYCTMKFADEVVGGYYTLANDVNFYGYQSGQDYVSNAARENVGFRGVIDGTKSVDKNGNVTEVYSFVNVKGSTYGMTIAMGKDALIKNVNFKNVIINNSVRTCLFSSYVMGARFENITIDFDSSSNLSSRGIDTDPCAVGIISTQKTVDSTFTNVTIEGSNFDIRCLMGKSASNNAFSNFVINCKSITYYYTGTAYGSDLEPTGGVKFSSTTIPGIIVNKK